MFVKQDLTSICGIFIYFYIFVLALKVLISYYRIAGYNRFLLDGYGLDSGRNQVWPDYDIKYLSESFIKKHHKELAAKAYSSL